MNWHNQRFQIPFVLICGHWKNPLLEHDEEIMLGRPVQRLMELEKIREELKVELGQEIDDRTLCDNTSNDWKSYDESYVKEREPKKRWYGEPPSCRQCR